MIEVFFDGKCGLCSKEISYYRGIAPVGIFVWMDIASDPTPLREYGITQADALRHLHVRDTDGQWHKGVSAFIIIWKHLSYWRLLSAFVGLPIIRHTASALYNKFADYRFAKLAHCQVAKNQLNSDR